MQWTESEVSTPMNIYVNDCSSQYSRSHSIQEATSLSHDTKHLMNKYKSG